MELQQLTEGAEMRRVCWPLASATSSLEMPITTTLTSSPDATSYLDFLLGEGRASPWPRGPTQQELSETQRSGSTHHWLDWQFILRLLRRCSTRGWDLACSGFLHVCWGRQGEGAMGARGTKPQNLGEWKMYSSPFSSPDCAEHTAGKQPMWKLSYATKPPADFCEAMASQGMCQLWHFAASLLFPAPSWCSWVLLSRKLGFR